MHYKKNSLGSFFSGAVAATAVIGYFLFGSKNAKKNRQKVENWVDDAADDIVEKMEKIKKASREKYDEIIDALLIEDEE